MSVRTTFAAVALLAGLAAPGGAQTGDSLGGTGRNSPGLDQKPGGGPVKVPDPESGAKIYRQICQACHMVDAKGGSGAGTIPALANNPKLAVAAYPITVVVRGKGAMPPFTTMLDEGQVAAVVTYVRTHFGNAYAKPVTEAEVKRLWVAPSSPEH